jgi:hypothetical protein
MPTPKKIKELFLANAQNRTYQPKKRESTLQQHCIDLFLPL